MRLISGLLGSVALLCLAMFGAEAATRDRASPWIGKRFRFQNMELTWNIQPDSSFQ